MSESVLALRDLIRENTKKIDMLREDQNAEQEALAVSQFRLENTTSQIAKAQARVAAYQATIDREEALTPGPDQPTNIPDHAVPWTPIEPAAPETEVGDE